MILLSITLNWQYVQDTPCRAINSYSILLRTRAGAGAKTRVNPRKSLSISATRRWNSWDCSSRPSTEPWETRSPVCKPKESSPVNPLPSSVRRIPLNQASALARAPILIPRFQWPTVLSTSPAMSPFQTHSLYHYAKLKLLQSDRWSSWECEHWRMTQTLNVGFDLIVIDVPGTVPWFID